MGLASVITHGAFLALAWCDACLSLSAKYTNQRVPADEERWQGQLQFVVPPAVKSIQRSFCRASLIGVLNSCLEQIIDQSRVTMESKSPKSQPSRVSQDHFRHASFFLLGSPRVTSASQSLQRGYPLVCWLASTSLLRKRVVPDGVLRILNCTDRSAAKHLREAEEVFRLQHSVFQPPNHRPLHLLLKLIEKGKTKLNSKSYCRNLDCTDVVTSEILRSFRQNLRHVIMDTEMLLESFKETDGCW